MYGINLRLSGRPRLAVLEAAIEAVTTANCAWYLEQWEKGFDPPCCCACAKVRWVEDEVSVTAVLPGVHQVFADRVASCHAAAAVDAGRGRAKAIRNGIPPLQAAHEHFVQLVRRPDRKGAPYFHAVYRTPNGIKDPTKEMPR